MNRYQDDRVIQAKNMFKQSVFRNGEELPEGVKSLKKSRLLYWEHVMMGILGGYVLSRYIWIPTEDATQTLITPDIFTKMCMLSSVLGIIFGWVVEFLYLRKSDVFETEKEKKNYIIKSALSGVAVVVVFYIMSLISGGLQAGTL